MQNKHGISDFASFLDCSEANITSGMKFKLFSFSGIPQIQRLEKLTKSECVCVCVCIRKEGLNFLCSNSIWKKASQERKGE